MSSEALALVTVEFMEKVLRNSQNDQSIEVQDLKTEPAVGKGDNYASEIMRASVKYSRNKSGLKVMEAISVVIKMSIISECGTKEMVTKFDSFQTEISMMQTTLVQMNDILNDNIYRLSGRLLYAEIGNPSLLVLEDLASLGFRMANRMVGLDLEHCLLAFKNLARFHASSVAVREKDTNPKVLFNKGLFEADKPKEWKQYCIAEMKSLVKELLTWPELDINRRSYSEKLLKFPEVCWDKTVECLNQRSDFNVINHGDCWVNNMLFRYDAQGKPINHIFVDFQQPAWNSPAIDILYFLSTSLAGDVELNHREDLLNEYLNTLTKTMSKLQCKTKPPTMEALEKSLKDYGLFGVMVSCLILAVVRLDASEAVNFTNKLLNDEYVNPSYKGQAYRKIILRRLPLWIAHGLIDD